MSARALEAVERILDGGGDSDDVLRAVVGALAGASGLSWAGILFVEQGTLVPGPAAGTPDERRRVRVPITYRGNVVGELAVDGEPDTAVLEGVATRISEHVLLGWDTGGEAWEP